MAGKGDTFENKPAISVERVGDVALVGGKARVEQTMQADAWKVFAQDDDGLWQLASTHETETDAIVAATVIAGA